MKTFLLFVALICATTTATPNRNGQIDNHMPRILVVTGDGDSPKKMQLWPKPDSQCALPADYPLEVSGAVGFWTAQGPTVCGGYGERKTLNKCFIYMEHQWIPWTNMESERYSASALQINPNQALIIGGLDEYDEYWDHLKTTELISSFSGSYDWMSFPVTIAGHCSFNINATHAMVTAGVQDRSESASTRLVDLTTLADTPGPTMKTRRVGHGCSIFQNGTKSFGIVAGGYNHNSGYLDSTEMIDLDQESPTWTEGPKLPRGLNSLTLVKTSQGTYAMGGKDEYKNARNEVFQLDCPGDQIQTCQWNQVGNLQFASYDHVSFALPESYDICRA